MDDDGRTMNRSRRGDVPAVTAQCACGAVRLEMQVPAFWAWHDHSRTTQRAHGAASATYVGTWRSRLRIIQGEDDITRFEDPAAKSARSFCRRCGTPLIYERASSVRMINIPRALFDLRTCREPRYHIALDEAPEWAYRGEKLGPLKGYPGVLWTGSARRKPTAGGSSWEPPP